MSIAPSHVHEGLDTPVRRIAQVLARFEANRLDLLAWIDRSWLPAWAERLAPALRRDEGALALAHAIGLGLPRLDACTADDPAQGALAMLSVEQAMTMLRVRSLWFRRNELRRLVGRVSRDHCAQLIGIRGAAGLLRHIQAATDGPQIESLRRAGMPAVDTLTAPALAWEGWCLFRRDGVLPVDGPADLVRLAMPREWSEPDWLAGCDRTIDAHGSARTLELLPHLFPERS
ncbi:type III secretion protein HrpB4 [Trinickia sp. Y13]|uniref:type III secretion protein HrpB4 n=1 Tax=Trinickia sp. Y13 TaxID=2917807 RepID=UPI0024069DD3|nr:type III secretion protein HrpB4 [Trinickia sp. Y13]MDG0025459.1 type III secretion protein HrpB4 [Trinickia sp. Y13]